MGDMTVEELKDKNLIDEGLKEQAERSRSRRALNFQRPPWHFLQFQQWYFDYIYKLIRCKYYSSNNILDKYTLPCYF